MPFAEPHRGESEHEKSILYHHIYVGMLSNPSEDYTCTCVYMCSTDKRSYCCVVSAVLVCALEWSCTFVVLPSLWIMGVP